MNVWGDIIERVAIVAVLALAIAAMPAMMAQEVSTNGGNGQNILVKGIFESGDNAFKFPYLTDTNFDSITVGNDNARAFGMGCGFPFTSAPAKAENNLEIEKNQQVGPCESCCNGNENCSKCADACTTVNIDQVHVGDRTANAFGLASGVNNVKLVLNQAP